MSGYSFVLEATDGEARRARASFTRGVVELPAFMPVGTHASVKAVTPEELDGLGTRIVVANTFHLMLRPGAETVEALGGLHRFMHWERPILTDSGGFQVFSLGARRSITEAGVEFRSPIDGSKVFLDAERSMEVQRALGSDVVMAFDDCTTYPMDEAPARASMERTLRWAKRSREAHAGNPRALFGIVQGGMHAPLRERSAQGLREIGFDGYAIGGLAVGEPFDERLRMLDATVPLLPRDRIRYLMGVGTPEDIVEAVRRGVGPLRLRAPDPQCAQRPSLRSVGGGQDPQPALPRRRRADRPGLRMPCVPALLARLPPSPRPVRRDPGIEAQHHPQPALLPAHDGRHARCDRGPSFRCVAACLRGAPRGRGARHAAARIALSRSPYLVR